MARDKNLMSENPYLKNSPGESYFDNHKFHQEVDFEEEGKESLRIFIKDFLDKVYSGEEELQRGFASDESLPNNLAGKLARLSGSQEDYEERWITKNNRLATQIFFEELITLVKEKRKDAAEQKNLASFVADLQEKLFSYSPNLSNQLGLSEMIRMSVLSTRIPEVQGWFGGTMIGELVYSLAYSDENITEDIIEQWKNKPIAEVLDFVEFLKSVGTHALANGEWAQPALEKVQEIILNLEKLYPAKMAQYAFSSAEDRLQEEWENPTVSVLTFAGNQNDSRLSESLDQNWHSSALKLSQTIEPDVKIPRGGKILPVASDVIAIFDHSNRALSYGYSDYTSLVSKPEIDNSTAINAGELKKYLTEILKNKNLSDDEWQERITNALNFLVSSGLFCESDSFSGEQVSLFLANKIGLLSKEDWLLFFESLTTINQCKADAKKYEQQVFYEAEENNERDSLQLIDKFRGVLIDLQNQNYDFGKQSELVGEFLSESNNTERQFVLMEEIVRSYTVLKSFSRADNAKNSDLIKNISWPESLSVVAEEVHELTRIKHPKSFEDAETKIGERIKEITGSDEFLTATADYGGCLFALRGGEKTFFKRLLNETEKIIIQNPLPSKQDVHFVEYEDLLNDSSVNPFGNQNKDLPLLLEHLHSPAMLDKINQDLGVNLRELPLRAQVYLLDFLADNDVGRFDQLKQVTDKYNTEINNNVLISFFSCAHDKKMGEIILLIAQELDAHSAQAIFDEYAEIVTEAQTRAAELKTEFGDELNEEAIIQGLLTRAKDILATAYTQILNSKDKNHEVDKILADLKKESAREMAVSGLFRQTSELLAQKGNNSVDPEQFVKQQDTILEALHREGGKSLLLRALHARGELKPIPEIFWRVDRSLEEYEERFGFNPAEFFKTVGGANSGKKIMLEFGPGSGISKAQRDNLGLTKNYSDLAITDAVYFSVKGWVENLIDWQAMETGIGIKLSKEDKDLLSELVYKTLMIKDGETEKKNFEYATDRIKEITAAPEKIKEVLAQILPAIAKVENIPTDYSEKDKSGKTIYPRSVSVTKKVSLDFMKAKYWLAENSARALNETDAFEAIPAFPSGVMIGDFAKVKSLKNNSVDAALGVRSTVYKTGAEYSDFMLSVLDKLKSGGVYIDDNIRENFGRGNRIEELSAIYSAYEAKHPKEKITIKIIFGPGVAGEDFTTDKKGVPMGFIISKNSDYSAVATDLMKPGYYLADIDNAEKIISS